jgi:hypothetical protein
MDNNRIGNRRRRIVFTSIGSSVGALYAIGSRCVMTMIEVVQVLAAVLYYRETILPEVEGPIR